MGILGFFQKRIMADCGHKTKKKDKITAFGQSCTTEVPIQNGHTPYCHSCLQKMAIRCAWCGKTIFIGDPVTLYTPRADDYEKPEYAVVHQENPLQVVGCLRWDCASTGADRAGFWLPPGKVERIQSPFEKVLANQDEGIIENDLTDMSNA